MFIYTAYNLCVHSQIPFPELISSEAIPETIEKLKLPDVVISLRQISDLEAESANGENCFLGIIEDGTAQVCRFLVEFGQQIVVEPTPGIEEDILHPLILGPIFAILLRQRGLLALHASCVVIDNGAVAFLGYSGWGKSTLANAFYNQGYSLLTDDVMAIQVGAKDVITFPGYPYVRLLPDSAASLGYEFEKLDFIHTGALKRNNILTQGFPEKPLPLKRVYVLENIGRSHNQIEPIQPQEAFVEMLRHSRVTNVLTNEDFVSSHLRQCTELIKKVPISRLKRQHSLAALPDLVKLIEEDLLQNKNIETNALKV
ncbi:Hpr(Ser) kinase/phosphatase [Calothrix sp. PCC 6303]|uniref:Hpr(Ser) kinase/phosphatase n=1 Tax=Calothrix sp. PCC 6303 TaxID=1170562 RepID=UPI0002A04A49|nr:Hpr(Ser) kinase/phosphatase [Calothrix sp. PCC 6303]AFZ00937.1 Hpr(Ser) kinase/phosphatase [Calothrix sp. PCC 6303]